LKKQLWINHKFVAFVITSLMINKIIFGKALNLAINERIVVIIVWDVVTLCFILGKSIDNAIYNAKISAEFKAGTQTNINTDTAKVIESAKNTKGE
jgi:membrane-bound acyltransferase YfiQ involved in biofilm formation